MALQPPLMDVLGARWALGREAVAVAWTRGCAAFALADGTVALAPVPWEGAPSLRRRKDGGAELVPAREGGPPPLARASISRGPCRALVGTAEGFLTGGADGRLRRLAPDGTAEKLAKFPAPVEAAAVAGDAGWACVAEGRVQGGPAAARDLRGVTDLASHQEAGLAVAHAGGVALCRAEIAEQLPGGVPAGMPGGRMAFSPDGRWLIAGAALWRLAPDRERVALPDAPDTPMAAAFSGDGAFLALAGPSGIQLWRLGETAAAVPGPWQGAARAATAIAFHPRRPLLAVAIENGAVVLGPAEDGGALLLRGAAEDQVTVLAFAADGAWLATGSAGGECGLVGLPDLLFRPAETGMVNQSEGATA
jgi:hypothetical protein